MYFKCELCGAVTQVSAKHALLIPKEDTDFKALCPQCGHTTDEPEMSLSEPDPVSLDLLKNNLGSEPSATRLISDDNTVWVYDTPHLWDADFDKVGSTVKVETATEALLTTMNGVLTRGKSVIDIVTLDAPGEGDAFDLMVNNVIKSAVLTGRSDLVIRILTGFVPVQGRFNAWTNALLKFVQTLGKDHPAPKLYVGQLYSATKTQWNHCKIMASDGCEAIVGGHNLWWASYGKQPVVHDISLHVLGQAAYNAQVFCEYLWNHGGWWLAAWKLTATTCDKTAWATITTKDSSEVPQMIFRCFPCEEDANKSISSAMVGAAEVTLKDTSTAKVGSAKLLAERALDLGEDYLGHGRAGRIMGLGRCSQSGDLVSTASDRAKEVVIKSATKSLRLCQQDLVFLQTKEKLNFVKGALFPFSEEDHKVCQWIAEALLNNGALEVEIVVSPQRAWGGGAQYSWTAGATGTMALIQKFLLGMAKDRFKNNLPDGKKVYQLACQRLKVAPFCFTSATFKTEADYCWPGIDAQAQDYPFSLGKVKPTPANHAKVYFADDAVCYVGSDNLYPNKNSEYGFVVEGVAAGELLSGYWAKVWKNSSAHVIAAADDWK